MMDKQYFIYKTVNTLNGHYYIGMHHGFTNDAYLGSGTRLRREIKKYGIQHFQRTILEVLDTKTNMALREAQIVTNELLKDPLCINMKRGGEGGQTSDIIKRNWKFRNQGMIDAAKANLVKATKKAASEESNEKRKGSFARIGHQSGKSNSQHGTCWVVNSQHVTKIRLERLDEYLASGYIRGRSWQF